LFPFTTLLHIYTLYYRIYTRSDHVTDSTVWITFTYGLVPHAYHGSCHTFDFWFAIRTVTITATLRYTHTTFTHTCPLVYAILRDLLFTAHTLRIHYLLRALRCGLLRWLFPDAYSHHFLYSAHTLRYVTVPTGWLVTHTTTIQPLHIRLDSTFTAGLPLYLHLRFFIYLPLPHHSSQPARCAAAAGLTHCLLGPYPTSLPYTLLVLIYLGCRWLFPRLLRLSFVAFVTHTILPHRSPFTFVYCWLLHRQRYRILFPVTHTYGCLRLFWDTTHSSTVGFPHATTPHTTPFIPSDQDTPLVPHTGSPVHTVPHTVQRRSLLVTVHGWDVPPRTHTHYGLVNGCYIYIRMFTYRYPFAPVRYVLLRFYITAFTHTFTLPLRLRYSTLRVPFYAVTLHCSFWLHILDHTTHTARLPPALVLSRYTQPVYAFVWIAGLVPRSVGLVVITHVTTRTLRRCPVYNADIY